MLPYNGLTVAFFVASGIGGAAGAHLWCHQLRKAHREATEVVESLIVSARALGLSSQRLLAEAALIDGLIRDLAHGHGLHYPQDDD